MKAIRMIVASSCAALLIFGGFLAGVTKNATPVIAAQDNVITVDEVEPNDEPLAAQEVPFPAPGQTVVINGNAAMDDDGFLSEEVETFFAFLPPELQFGSWHDVYVMDPDTVAKQDASNGPYPMRFTMSWEGETVMYLMVGMRVDDFIFFFDGFKITSSIMMTSSANPQIWPGGPRYTGNAESVVLYQQPEGVTDQEGNPIPNDGFGRDFLIIVKNFEGPATDYTITVERFGGEAVMAKQEDEAPQSEEHYVDDNGITFSLFRGFEGAYLVNCFQPSRYPATLTTISHPFMVLSDFPDPTGRPIRMIVFTGDSDDPLAPPPPLSEANILFDQMVPIPGTISPQPGSRYVGAAVNMPVDPPVTIESGVVYVGFQFEDRELEETGAIPVADVSPVQYLRTWTSEDGETWGRPAAEEDLSAELVALNADIRATFEFGDDIASTRASRPKAHLGSGRQVRVAPILRRAITLKSDRNR